MNREGIEARLAQFIKPEFMPLDSRRINFWVEAAAENGGYIEVPAHWTISGHTELFSL